MKYCTRDEILHAHDYKVKDVKAPEWGGEGAVTGVRTFSAAVRSALISQTGEDGKMPADWMEQVVAASACDQDGNLIFTKEDVGSLSEKSAIVLERLFRAAIELNGLAESSVEEIKGE